LEYNKSVVCTNAFISAYLRGIYDPHNPRTHIWNKFDAIIVDEVHSLVTDATYQPAVFDVLAFIREYLEWHKSGRLQEDACKHLILMTGTPLPFETYVDLDFPADETNVLELFTECENVVPKNVVVADETIAHSKIRELLDKGEKIIYFTNRTLAETEVRRKFNVSDSIKIGVSFSSEDKRKNQTAEAREEMARIETSLAMQSRVPDDIQFFVTTSRNKEGINIQNDDFGNMFVETHLMYDAVQMAGRVRSGVENLYIISNARQFEYNNTATDIAFSKRVMVANRDFADSEDKANEYLASTYSMPITDSKLIDETAKRRCYYIKYIEERFAYIRYNVFDQKFDFFHIKEDAERMANMQVQTFSEMITKGDSEYIQRWFGPSTITLALTAKERAFTYLMDVVGKQGWTKVNREELKKHLSVVQTLFNSNLKTANPILHLVNEKFNCKQSGKNYILYYGDEDPRIKTKAMAMRRKR
jgi:hypothetical protein